MFTALVRRAAQQARPSYQAYLGQTRQLHRTKKVWPPDFKKLSLQEQLRFEKKFKRRMTLATKRPRWDRLLRVVQLFSITSVIIYAVLFMDWQSERHPFSGVRKSMWNLTGYDYKPSPTESAEPTEPAQKMRTQGLPQVK